MVALKDFFKICNNAFDTIFISYFDIDENYSSKEYRQEKEVLEKYKDAFVCEFMVDTEKTYFKFRFSRRSININLNQI